MLRKEQLLTVHGINHHIALSNPQSCFNRVKEAATHPFLDDNSVYHNLNIMLPALGKLWQFRYIVDIAIHANPDIAVFLNLVKNGLMLSLFLANDRRQNLQPLTLWQFQNFVDNLFNRRSLNSSMSIDTVGRSNTRIEQAQVIIDFSGSSHC